MTTRRQFRSCGVLTRRMKIKLCYCCHQLVAIACVVALALILMNLIYVSVVHHDITHLQRQLPFNSTQTANQSSSAYTYAADSRWVDTLSNVRTGQVIHCDCNKYKYLHLISQQLHDLYASQPFHDGTKITTQYINEHIVQKKQYQHEHDKQHLRLKFISGKLYFSKYQHDISYRFSWWLYYFMRLAAKYGAFIPDTDLVIFMGDTGNKQFDYDIFPFFVGDGVVNKGKVIRGQHMDQLPLFVMPRSFIWLHQTPVDGHADVLCYRDAPGYNMFESKINKAVFRGAPTGGDWRTSKRGAVIVPSVDQQLEEQFDAKFSCWREGKQKHNNIHMKYCAAFTNTTHQMKYRYLLMIDGNSVRDAFPKQLAIGSLLLKQKSPFMEFWYYDVMDGDQLIEWLDFADLKELVFNLTHHFVDTETQKRIANNGRRFVDEYLVDKHMDCFHVHMIQLYNQYFFESRSVQQDSFDVEINPNTIKDVMRKGYGSHVYDFEYECPTNGEMIVSQKY